jgi:hypothetical protein
MTGLRPRTLLWQLGLALMVMQSVVAVVFGAYGFGKLKRFHHEHRRGCVLSRGGLPRPPRPRVSYDTSPAWPDLIQPVMPLASSM